MDPWSYIAPSSGNIISTINGEEFTEDYFEADHEGVSCLVEKKKSQKNKEVKIKQEVMSPIVQEVIYEMKSVTPHKEVIVKTEKVSPQEEEEIEEVRRKQRRRRSMSVSAVMETTNIVSHVTEMAHGIQKIHLNSIKEKQKHIHDTSTSKSLKSISSASSQTNLTTSTKFVSMAEAIYYLQKDTPERFHSYSKKREMQPINAAAKSFQRKMPCIPQSPALMAKTRNRNVKVLSRKEKEDLEYEKIKNYHIKAIPIPKAVTFGTSNFPHVQRKGPTRPMPFNLTEVKKKPPPPEKKIVFCAKPVPKHILEKPVELPKKTIHVTVPKSPNFISKARSRSLENMPQRIPENNTQRSYLKKGRNPLQVSMDGGLPDQGGVGHSGVPLAQKTTCHPCKPKPFSFEQRDKEMFRKKEEKIQMVLDEERRLREFHANPIPSIIKKTKGQSPKSKLFEKKIEYKKENKENECEDKHKAFKARPPVVLFKDPFKPMKVDRPVLEPCLIQLTTEIRAQKRNIFNQVLKEKEEQLELIKEQHEIERLKREEEEKAALRTQLVHKAAPVRHYQPVIIHPSEVPLTRPESPKFQSGKS